MNKQMKAFSYSLKAVLVSLIMATFILSSCKHNQDELTPDIASRASGNYLYSELNFEGKNIPANETSIKGSIRINRKTDSTVDVQLDIRQKATNDEFMVQFVENVVVSEGKNTIDLFYQGERVAQIKGNKLMVNGVDENDSSFTIVAVK